jgi:hypothetical protein
MKHLRGHASPLGGWAAAHAAGINTLEEWMRGATGPRIPITTTQSGNVTITTPAEAADMAGVHFTSSIITFANSSPIAPWNFKVTAPSGLGTTTHYNCLNLPNGVSNIDFRYITLRGGYQRAVSGFGGTSYNENVNLRYMDIAEMGDDAGKLYRNGVMEYCWIHDGLEWDDELFGVYNPSANNVQYPHLDGGQVLRSGNTIRRNLIRLPTTVNVVGTVTAGSDIAGENIDGLMVEENTVEGGYVYCMHYFSGAGGAPANVTVRNNRFSRNYGGYGSVHPISSGSVGSNYSETGNVWDDTGLPIS